MGNLFPTMWELILPNWNFTTLLGIILIVMGVLGLLIFFGRGQSLQKLGLPFNPAKISSILLLVGIVLIWGVSIFQDFVTSTGGAIIFWGVIVVIGVGIMLFWEPNSKSQRKTTSRLKW